MKIPEFTPAERICCMSVEDGKYSLKRGTSLGGLQEALEYERSHMNRPDRTKILEAWMRAIARQRLKDLAEKARRINGYRA